VALRCGACGPRCNSALFVGTTASAGQRACRARDAQSNRSRSTGALGRIIRPGQLWAWPDPAYFLYINARAYLCLSPWRLDP